MEVLKVDPSTTPAVAIDGINAVTGYPPALLSPAVSGIAPGQLIQINGSNLGPATAVNGQVDATGRLQTTEGYQCLFRRYTCASTLGQDNLNRMFRAFRDQPGDQRDGDVERSKVQCGQAGRDHFRSSDSERNQSGRHVELGIESCEVGSTIVIYASGLGETSPLSVDGLVNSAPLPVPFLVSVYLPAFRFSRNSWVRRQG